MNGRIETLDIGSKVIQAEWLAEPIIGRQASELLKSEKFKNSVAYFNDKMMLAYLSREGVLVVGVYRLV